MPTRQPQTAFIKFLIATRHKTQRAIAKQMGVTPPMLSQVINGRKCSQRVEKKLARILGVSRETLFPVVIT